jgi:large subunit ribosomal protein L10
LPVIFIVRDSRREILIAPPSLEDGRPAQTLSRSLGKEDELKKEEKSEVVAGLREKFQRARGVVLTEYKGLTVAEVSALRDALRAASVEYKVVKNTLARIASEGTPAAAGRDFFKGPLGVAIDYADPARVAKEVLAFAGKNEKLKVVGGVLEGEFCDPLRLKAVSELPPREVLLGMVAGTMQAPASKFARLLTASVSRFAYALSALKEKKAEAGQAAA